MSSPSTSDSRPSEGAIALADLYRQQLEEYRAPGAPRPTPQEQREQFDEELASMGAVPPDAVVEPDIVGGVAVRWVSVPESGEGRLVVYFHGGGYVLGSISGYSEFAARVARSSGSRVVLVDYALAPEHPFPAALHDATAVYRALLERGYIPSAIVAAGDSAGGGLATAALAALRADSVPMPAGLICLSPWVDLNTRETEAGAHEDLAPEQLNEWAGHYLGGNDPSDGGASPVYADLRGLPPTLIQVGSAETLFEDSLRLERSLGAAGIDVTLEVFDGLVHLFQLVPDLPEAVAAVDSIGSFVARLARSG